MKLKDKVLLISNFVILIVSLFTYIGYLNNLFGFKIVTISLCVTVSVTFYLLYKKRKGFLLVYLLYLFLTNFGVFITNVFLANPLVEYHGDLSWYKINKTNLFSIATLAILIFTILSNLIGVFSKANSNIKFDIKRKGNDLFYYSGILFIIGFTIQFLFYILTGQLAINTYGDYINSLQELPMYSYGLLFFSIGIAFAFSNVKKTHIKYLVIILVPQVLLFFITGNRGEVFYPVLTALGVLIVRNYKIKWWMIITIVFILFFVIPFIKEFRNLDGAFIEKVNINWFSSLVEIGYTLRPLGYVTNWIDGGESIAYGKSYLAPVQNIFSNFILGIDPVNYEMVGYGFRYRLPGMGFNVIAEAYYNGATVGVVIIILLLVLLLWKFSNFKSFEMLSMGTAIVSVLINNIRNAFSFVPAHILIIIIIVIILLFIDNYIKKEMKAD